MSIKQQIQKICTDGFRNRTLKQNLSDTQQLKTFFAESITTYDLDDQNKKTLVLMLERQNFFLEILNSNNNTFVIQRLQGVYADLNKKSVNYILNKTFEALFPEDSLGAMFESPKKKVVTPKTDQIQPKNPLDDYDLSKSASPEIKPTPKVAVQTPRPPRVNNSVTKQPQKTVDAYEDFNTTSIDTSSRDLLAKMKALPSSVVESVTVELPSSNVIFTVHKVFGQAKQLFRAPTTTLYCSIQALNNYYQAFRPIQVEIFASTNEDFPLLNRQTFSYYFMDPDINEFDIFVKHDNPVLKKGKALFVDLIDSGYEEAEEDSTIYLKMRVKLGGSRYNESEIIEIIGEDESYY